MHEELRVGLDAVETVTTLLQRVRTAHPTAGLYQAAELQWWWATPRSSDTFEQLFWFDDQGRPVAAVTMNDFSNGGSALFEAPTIVVATLPDATVEWRRHVLERGLAHLGDRGISGLEVEVGTDDVVLRELLVARGFGVRSEGIVQAWLEVESRPDISPLHDGYRLVSRQESQDDPHHMSDERRADIEERLGQLSMYRTDLDLVVLSADGEASGHGIFWFDPVSATGVVEPMRTHDAHQQRGLARHILTSGLDRLARAGAERISICYEPSNPASGHLYRSVGFEPQIQSELFSNVDTAQ